MTIERIMFLDKPVLASAEEGLGVANERFQDLLRQVDPAVGPKFKIKMPQGEYNLLSSDLKEKGYDFSLKVLEDGKGVISVESHVEGLVHAIETSNDGVIEGVRSIRLPEDTYGIPLVIESENGESLELHEFIIFKEGSNPLSEITSIS